MKKLFVMFIVLGFVLGLSSMAVSYKNDKIVKCDKKKTGKVVIKRDTYGVPHVYAKKLYGLFYGYGYAIAQDRLFQLEMIRRSGQGRVAEVMGADYLDFDKNIRIHFKPSSIQSQIENLSRKDKEVLEGYAAGINAHLKEIEAAPDTLMSKQFLDFDFEPQYWTAYDVAMIYVGTMINRFGDMNTELTNLFILNTLIAQHGEETGKNIFDQLIPRNTLNGAPTSIPEGEWSPVAKTNQLDPKLMLAKLNIKPRHIPDQESVMAAFSNCVLIGKDKAENADAILVGGPQFGYFNPSYVYSVGLHGAGFDVVGNSPFGYPAVMFGHNKHIAWGTTYGAGDHIDVYVETIRESGESYEYFHQGEYLPMEKRIEIIKVKGADDVLLDVYRTVHGPVTEMDLENNIAYAKKRNWEGLELEQLFGWICATKAKNFNSWKTQVSRSAQSIHHFYADQRGNIGHYYSGKYPERQADHDGRLPASGEGGMEWLGFKSVDDNPWVLNPAQGFIANWNNSPAQGYPAPDTWWYSWGKADRVQEFFDALAGQDRFTADQAWDLIKLTSFVDVNARYFIPWIERAFEDVADDDPIKPFVETLSNWDYQSRDENMDGFYDELATTVSRTFLPIFLQKSLQDDLGGLFGFFGYVSYTNPGTGTKALVESLEDPDFQEYDFFNGVDPLNLIKTSLEEAIVELEETFGSDLEAWRLPVIQMTFSPFSFFGVPQAGIDEAMVLAPTMNRGSQNNLVVFDHEKLTSYEVTPPGQSGFIAPDGTKASHYGDQLQMYQDFKNKRVWLNKKDVNKNLESVTRLK